MDVRAAHTLCFTFVSGAIIRDFWFCRFTGETCLTFAYTPDNDPIITSLMEDLRLEHNIPQDQVRAFATPQLADAFLTANPNSTLAVYKPRISLASETRFSWTVGLF